MIGAGVLAAQELDRDTASRGAIRANYGRSQMTEATLSDTRALDELSINTIRTLSMDAVQKANSGHPGTPMALAPLAYLLYTRVMKHNPANDQWFDRDRFVLSAGHASMLLYSMLYLTGYGLELDDLKNFRQLGSPTAGPPRAQARQGHRDHHRPARPGHLERRRPRARRAHARRPLQHRRRGDHRPLHLHDRLRRRPAGGRGLRGVLDRRAPRPRPADRLLRRQPHLDRGRHRAVLLRGCGQALRGLWLARAGPGRGDRARAPPGGHGRREGRGGPAVAGDHADAHRGGQPEQAGHRGRPRQPARRGGGAAHQGGLRLAARRAVPRARRGACALSPVRRPRARARGAVERAPGVLPGGQPRAGGTARADDGGPAARRLGQPTCRASSPRTARWRPARPRVR